MVELDKSQMTVNIRRRKYAYCMPDNQDNNADSIYVFIYLCIAVALRYNIGQAKVPEYYVARTLPVSHIALRSATSISNLFCIQFWLSALP